MKLYTKILFWFFLNLVVLGAAFYAVFRFQFQFGLDSLLMGRAGDRIQAVSEVIRSELSALPESRWNEVLRRFSGAYQVSFFLFRSDGSQAAGEPIALPAEVLAKVAERRGPYGGLGLGRGPRQGWGPPPGRGPNRAMASSVSPSKFMVQTAHPSGYWFGVSLPPAEGERAGARPLMLLARSASLHRGGLFMDTLPWAAVGFAALLFSVLFWLPLVRNITRYVSQMTRATEQIAEGRFEARVPWPRRDELGRLAQAINRMADRLSGFVTGQKRFLGDIAHELCSPLARIQVALGILEQQANASQQAYVNDVREDVQHMSSLVNELLSFSKAGLQPHAIQLEPVNLAALARQVADRERPSAGQIEVQVDEQLQVLAEPDLLARALANLVRNAVRYAGTASPITLSAKPQGDQVALTVADAGPGVPAEALEHIFDPFFRLEASRSRDTGGMGLGLAIVKTCIEACQGSVTARNRQPTGLQVDITLRTPPR